MSVMLCGAGKDIYTEAVGCKAQNIKKEEERVGKSSQKGLVIKDQSEETDEKEVKGCEEP